MAGLSGCHPITVFIFGALTSYVILCAVSTMFNVHACSAYQERMIHFLIITSTKLFKMNIVCLNPAALFYFVLLFPDCMRRILFW